MFGAAEFLRGFDLVLERRDFRALLQSLLDEREDIQRRSRDRGRLLNELKILFIRVAENCGKRGERSLVVVMRFQKQELGPTSPSREAEKGSRSVFREGGWQGATLWEMDALKPGNAIEGLAIIEHPATTFLVPPGRRVEVDEWNILWLR